MSAEIKWEPIEPSALRPGDRIRLTHDNGDLIHGEAAATRAYDIRCMHFNGIAEALLADGYRFERAVPERTLPTEPGVYRCTSAPLDKFGSIYTLNTGGRSSDDRARDLSEQSVPADLVRLVPATEAEELRKRIDTTREYLTDFVSLKDVSDEAEKRILARLAGEVTTNV